MSGEHAADSNVSAKSNQRMWTVKDIYKLEVAQRKVRRLSLEQASVCVSRYGMGVI